tara:strand:- start:475 stop:621 length:147 start_codon:yes stop_codon:yes gene_type:complete
MASTMREFEANDYWLKMPEMIGTFAGIMKHTHLQINYYLDCLEDAKDY